MQFTWMSVMSKGALAFQATAALQVMLFPLVAFNWFIKVAGTTVAMFRLITEDIKLAEVLSMTAKNS